MSRREGARRSAAPASESAPQPRLTRLDLENDILRRALEQGPLAAQVLTEQALEASMQAALASPHRQPDVWLFAYGSLVWNPVLDFEDRCVVSVHGYHRSFCLWSRVNRGTPERPGLVLGLDRGGRCTGVAYRIPQALAEGELRLLWRREMLLGSYFPRWVHVTRGSDSFRALAFVVDRASSGYAGRLPTERVVAILRRAQGRLGSGVDYLRLTVDGLAAHGIRDPHLLRVDAAMQGALGDVEPHTSRADLQP
ncbi:MAG: gamma-glutamylcyclotransferase [Burkholderiales bacterium]|nr:gamma-glutamylcyclotransferase [Burkholderiales bacterium]